MKANEFQTLQQKYDKLQEEHEKQVRISRNIQNQCMRKVAQLKAQLIGTIRRVNYLVEEKKNMIENSLKRDKYVSTLELELLRKNERLKELLARQKKVDVSPYLSKTQRSPLRGSMGDSATDSIREYAKTLKDSNAQSLKDVEKEIQQVQNEVLLNRDTQKQNVA
eukprot:TRINITY_DN898_c0_g1_i1.p5 TRINITY_DN898_c0_g1~~TRINITY_DN898_c0_g1_i1.p5  ORF type:complete len:165 (-),score=23.83 TRINITY_DN898_c0_g1_i1:3462-3956(-)